MKVSPLVPMASMPLRSRPLRLEKSLHEVPATIRLAYGTAASPPYAVVAWGEW